MIFLEQPFRQRPSYRQYVDKAQWLLAPLVGDRRAHAALDRVADRIRIAPPRPRQVLDGLDRGIEGDVEEGPAVRRGLRDANHFDLRIAGQRAFLVERHRDRNDADKAEPAAVR